jgi:NADH-quinone oxidoreductase subunit J
VNPVFYISGAVALASTAMVITRSNAAHAALYLMVSLLAVAMVFFSLGAPFVAALEIVIYAGAIMVLFVFVIMMLNMGPAASAHERAWLNGRAWIGPSILALVLAAELIYVLTGHAGAHAGNRMVDPKTVARSLFGPYVLAVELASFLLLAGLVGAYHLGVGPDAKEQEHEHGLGHVKENA